MTEETIVRENLMVVPNYTGYCGNNIPRGWPKGCDNPRTIWNGSQFRCPKCGWVSQFPQDFIERYKQKWNL